MSEGAVAAVDLGASSGRVIVGRVADGRVSLEEVHRFPNEPGPARGRPALGRAAPPPRDPHRAPAGGARRTRPAQHRHRHLGRRRRHARRGRGRSSATRSTTATRATLPAVDRVHARIPQAELYARTGLQFMPINTLYQLEAARVTPAFAIVRRRPAAARPARVLADRRRRRRAHARVDDRAARSADRRAGTTELARAAGARAVRCCRRSPTPARSGDRCCRGVRAATGLPRTPS